MRRIKNESGQNSTPNLGHCKDRLPRNSEKQDSYIFHLIISSILCNNNRIHFRGTGTGEASSITVGVVNLDGESIEVNGAIPFNNSNQITIDITTTSNNQTIGIAFIESMKAANFTVSQYSEYGNKEAQGTAAYDISRGEIQIAVIIPANFTETLSFQYTDGSGTPLPTRACLEVYTDPSDPTGSLIAQQSVMGVISGFVKQYQNIAMRQVPSEYEDFFEVLADPISISSREAEISERPLNWIDYRIPGTLGLVLLWSGLNHSSISIASERTRGTFQRMIIAPVSPTTVLIGKLLSGLALVYLSSAIMLISSILIFNVNLYWNIPAITLAIFLGALSAIGIGLIISSLAKNEEAANSIAVIISVPLQFFIGAFFPLEIMPRAAQAFGRILPFTKLVLAMQNIMTKNLPLEAVMPQIVYMTFSGIILFALGVEVYMLSLKRL